jgi:hypothetical protein
MSVDTADQAEKNELTKDMKGTAKEAANEVQFVGLQVFSLNRYHYYKST